MVKIAVVGDGDSIKGFACVGLDIYSCAPDKEEAVQLLRTLAAGDYGIIYITEEVFAAAGQEIARYDEQLSPAIVPIPGLKGNTGIGMQRLRDSVEKAVGSDIVFNDK